MSPADLTVSVSSASWAGQSVSRVDMVGSRPELTPTKRSSSSHSSCRRDRGSFWRAVTLRQERKKITERTLTAHSAGPRAAAPQDVVLPEGFLEDRGT